MSGEVRVPGVAVHDVGAGDIRHDLEIGAEGLDRARSRRRARRARRTTVVPSSSRGPPNARTCTSIDALQRLHQFGDVHPGAAVDLRRVLLRDDVDAHVIER